MASVAQVQEQLQGVWEECDALARASGFMRRARKLTGRVFARCLAFGLLNDPQATYADLAQEAALVGAPVSPQAIEQRIGPAAAAFLRSVLERAVSRKVAADPVAVPLLARLQGVYIRDSTVLPLPRALHTLWEGCGDARGASAGVKLQLCLDYATGALEGPALRPAREHDSRSPFQEEELPAGALRLADLGFFSLACFARDAQRGVFWISRLKAGTVVCDRAGRRLVLRTWLGAHHEEQFEEEILLGARQQLPCRLLAQRVPEEVAARRRARLKEYARKKQVAVSAETLALADWTLVVTNAPSTLLTFAEVLTLVHVRWQVEVLFKLYKDRAHLDEWRSSNPWRIVCDVYAKLIGLVLTQWLFALGLWEDPARSVLRAFKVVQRLAPLLATALNDAALLCGALQTICRCFTAGCRVDKRHGRPSTYQRLMGCRDP